ncbi:hypothetical protein A3D01_00350 [Candidatus Woesebacteria bacterium RIFCSPHIGHO2_02_FULL_39_13]|uniref:Uncharacterized protein n=1 Tax=Candidatus Woesebacteria bacterium RIFCSPHIGHO2_02_FULL_39_13 TaxID=1802505 RepID=A0A1F7Z194_9BACT|nr:MAG: hypothetical protein A2692_04630 [Candidatus Woesebacteria bacterium RIFCSPHIGHO2_01_FULL_39_95]OGM33327.1 MAG: hypothetical protein A3D01_00350 [Candidatus Woesebacteria bacterium RIFCSPHIGHO2_02_FULL_39_13]OGM74617.1 MAG: hypothetical protein A3H19_04160 [Candidatus Woesebacteria bacterium RIFCSPLOWO2_12_FULL_39_9]
MKLLVKKTNKVFICFLLIIIYYSGLGISFAVYKLVTKKTDKKNSFWMDSITNSKKEKKYFLSPY